MIKDNVANVVMILSGCLRQILEEKNKNDNFNLFVFRSFDLKFGYDM